MGTTVIGRQRKYVVGTTRDTGNDGIVFKPTVAVYATAEQLGMISHLEGNFWRAPLCNPVVLTQDLQPTEAVLLPYNEVPDWNVFQAWDANLFAVKVKHGFAGALRIVGSKLRRSLAHTHLFDNGWRLSGYAKRAGCSDFFEYWVREMDSIRCLVGAFGTGTDPAMVHFERDGLTGRDGAGLGGGARQRVFTRCDEALAWLDAMQERGTLHWGPPEVRLSKPPKHRDGKNKAVGMWRKEDGEGTWSTADAEKSFGLLHLLPEGERYNVMRTIQMRRGVPNSVELKLRERFDCAPQLGENVTVEDVAAEMERRKRLAKLVTAEVGVLDYPSIQVYLRFREGPVRAWQATAWRLPMARSLKGHIESYVAIVHMPGGYCKNKDRNEWAVVACERQHVLVGVTKDAPQRFRTLVEILTHLDAYVQIALDRKWAGL